MNGSSTFLAQVLLLWSFPFFVLEKQVLLCFGHGWRRISHNLGTPLPKKSYLDSEPSPMRPNEVWICPDMEPPGLCLWWSTVLVVGPFEEEEEGIGISSNVFKVQGMDPATPDSRRGDTERWHVGDPFRRNLLLGPPLRKPRDRNDSPTSVQ